MPAVSSQVLSSPVESFSGEDIIEIDEVTVFDVLRAVVFWLSPGIFLVGILLILYGNYKKLETMLSREMGLRKKIFPKLENNNYAFQQWLLEKNTLTGLICLISALIFFFALR
ncbi:MAG: hypothetical protein WC431_02225 [Candidatus Omnitrophota bacterium]